ncbi:MAG: hypothetical protein H6909_03120 [Rickettsiaceae bacterium]|nr:hypothetical protein [Rickettsiaceae bacterium]
MPIMPTAQTKEKNIEQINLDNNISYIYIFDPEDVVIKGVNYVAQICTNIYKSTTSCCSDSDINHNEPDEFYESKLDRNIITTKMDDPHTLMMMSGENCEEPNNDNIGSHCNIM